MTTDKREIDFVLRYFAAGRLNTAKALQQVKLRAGIAASAPSRLRLRRRWAAVAAGIAVLIAFGAYMLSAASTVTLHTAAAQQAFTLPDGTRVTLAPHSSLTYSGDDCRNVEMQGKIYFEVRHDEAHPFDVRGSAAHVRVLGTQFEVDDRGASAPHGASSASRSGASASQSGTSASVFVTGGRVLFAALHRDSGGVILDKGMKAVLPRGAARPVLSEDADINEVAWATHRIHFADAPMDEVLRVLGEYYGMRLTASDMSKRLTGDFDARNRQQVIQVIGETLGIEITEK